MARNTKIAVTRSEAAILIDNLQQWVADSALTDIERDTMDDLHTYLLEEFGFDPGYAPRVIVPRSAEVARPESQTDQRQP